MSDIFYVGRKYISDIKLCQNASIENVGYILYRHKMSQTYLTDNNPGYKRPIRYIYNIMVSYFRIIGKGGIKLKPNKIDAMKEAGAFDNVSDLKSFLRLGIFNKKFKRQEKHRKAFRKLLLELLIFCRPFIILSSNNT